MQAVWQYQVCKMQFLQLEYTVDAKWQEAHVLLLPAGDAAYKQCLHISIHHAGRM